MAESKGADKPALRPEDGAMSAIPDSYRPDYIEAFGDGSALAGWLKNQIDQARKEESHRAESCFEHSGGKVNVRFETLRFPGQGSRYAVLISRLDDSIQEGSSLITRQQWHDIKNHLGGLKLYATFLKKKISDSEDQAIVEKLLNGINGLIDHLAQIRRGDAK